uniref:Uncharacterized protein n=1 Tax=Anopheles dirus TaxID=7168 RepID=A0A182NMY4_9DIPT
MTNHRYSNKVLLRKRNVRSLFAIKKAVNRTSAEIQRVSDEFALNVKVLQQLGEPINNTSFILIELLIQKLDDDSISSWEESQEPERQPTYQELLAFLRKRINTLENIAIDCLSVNAGTPRKAIKARVTANTQAKSFDINNWEIPVNIPLAYPSFNCSNRIDMILGASHFYEFLKEGRIRLTTGALLVEK